MSLDSFRKALGSKLGEVITPELAAWLEANAFDRLDLSFDPAIFGSALYRGLLFRVERIRDIEKEIHPLHELHWQETEKHRHGLQMQPNYAGFKASEMAGRLLQFTARDADGALVGNIRMKLYTSEHTQRLVAQEDTFYLMPAARKGFTAIRFWQFMEQAVEAIGVGEIYTDSKVANQVGRLNEYLGYTHVANVYHKFLGEKSCAVNHQL
ncbi:hypothetical protein D9M73_50870 [compost metagenome]